MIKLLKKFIVGFLALSAAVVIAVFFMPKEGVQDLTPALHVNDGGMSKTVLGFDRDRKTFAILGESSLATSTLEPVQFVPPNTEVYTFQVSPDGKSVYYVLRTGLEYDVINPQGGYAAGRNESFAVIYRFDLESKATEAILSDKDINLQYPSRMTFSPGEKRIAFETYGCTECGGGGPLDTIIFNKDIPRHLQQFKNLGPGVNFKFTGPTTYEYYEWILDPECKAEMAAACSKAGAKHVGEF